MKTLCLNKRCLSCNVIIREEASVYLRERLRVLHRGRGGCGDHCGGGAELRVLAAAAHRARTAGAGAPIAAVTIANCTLIINERKHIFYLNLNVNCLDK